MNSEKVRTPVEGSIGPILFVCWVVLGSHLIEKYFFNYGLSGPGYGLLIALLVLSAYPVFGWKRTSPWKYVGRWSFTKWVVFAVALGIIVPVFEFLISFIVPYFVRRT